MKKRLFSFLSVSGLLIATSPAPIVPNCADCNVAFARETAVSADFNNDTYPDILIADRENGQLRVALGSSTGAFTISSPRAVLPEISGLAVGHLFSPTANDAIVMHPRYGRAVGVRLSGPDMLSSVPLDTAGIGPDKALLMRVGSGAPAGYDDAVVSTSLNGAPSDSRVETRRNSGGSLVNLAAVGTLPSYEEVLRMFPISVDRTPSKVLAALVVGSPYGSAALQLHDVGDGVMNVSSPDVSLSVGAQDRIVSGFFGPSLDWRMFVLSSGFLKSYKLTASPLSVVNSTPNAAPDYSPQYMVFPSRTIASLAIVRGAGPAPDRLLVVFEGGSPLAGVYDYIPGSFPQLVKELSPKTAAAFIGGVPMANGDFVMFEGPSSSGVSSSMARYDRDGVLLGSTALPASANLASRGNVLFFKGAPLVEPHARLVGTANAGDWSSGVASGSPLPSPLNVTRELFLGSSAGLGSPSSTSAGAPPAGATHALGSQFAADISYFNLGPAAAAIADTVTASPSGGSFDSAVEVELSSAENERLAAAGMPATRTIYSRLDTSYETGAWQLYNPAAPLILLQSGVLAFYSESAGGERSPIGSAVFFFDSGSDAIDSDGDGVPDYVEQAKGLDPRSGGDGDGDGDSDLAEIAAGTDPADPADSIARAADGTRLGALDQAAFDLAVTVVGRDGSSTPAANRAADTNVSVSVQSPGGALLGSARTLVLGSASTATISGVATDASMPYVCASTPPNFALTGATNTNCPVPGREMASLVAVPNSTTVLPDAYFWGGSIVSAANNWVSALHALNLPTSGAIILIGGYATTNGPPGNTTTNYYTGSATIPASADAALVKARLDAANSGAGWLSSGPSTVTGSMPRFVVSIAAPAGTGAGGIQALSTLDPSCTVRIGEKQKAGVATPLVFEIVVTPAAQKVAATASVAETVSTLLVEEKLGTLLGRTNLTLLPGRAGDESRVPLGDSDLSLLASGGVAAVSAYTFSGLNTPIRSAVTAAAPAPNVAALLQVASAVYEFSSRRTNETAAPLSESEIGNVLSNNVIPPDIASDAGLPIDILRSFIRTGVIDSRVTNAPAPSVVSSAVIGVGEILGSVAPRPEGILTLTMGYSGEFELPGGGFPSMPVSYKLLEAGGNPYAFNKSLDLRPGAQIAVTGYTDVSPPSGFYGQAIEVKSVVLLSLATSPGADTDGNLLGDAYEQAFFGGIGQNAYAEGAGGKSLVQLYLDASDPLLGSGSPLVDLFPRSLRLSRSSDSNYTMHWKFPAAYAGAFGYELQTAFSLTNVFSTSIPEDLITTVGENNELPLGLPADSRKQFWRLKMHLHR